MAIDREKLHARIRRYQRKNKKRVREWQRKGSRNWRRKNREKLAELHFRYGRRKETAIAATAIGGRIATRQSLDKPELVWLDAHGRLHREKELSAEELIRQWKKEQRKCRKK